MVAPQTLLAGIDAVGWTLLHFLWQGALLGAAYALVSFFTFRVFEDQARARATLSLT